MGNGEPGRNTPWKIRRMIHRSEGGLVARRRLPAPPPYRGQIRPPGQVTAFPPPCRGCRHRSALHRVGAWHQSWLAQWDPAGAIKGWVQLEGGLVAFLGGCCSPPPLRGARGGDAVAASGAGTQDPATLHGAVLAGGLVPQLWRGQRRCHPRGHRPHPGHRPGPTRRPHRGQRPCPGPHPHPWRRPHPRPRPHPGHRHHPGHCPSPGCCPGPRQHPHRGQRPHPGHRPHPRCCPSPGHCPCPREYPHPRHCSHPRHRPHPGPCPHPEQWPHPRHCPCPRHCPHPRVSPSQDTAPSLPSSPSRTPA